ncbi:hypothetical protein ACQEVF_52310 [Nonomuraea polychroma]|uniref:hypothetical protein n=1 Tax=Nonomuraea polychroma TaxID=46176 RepID=UPI003D8D03E6
MMVCRAWTTPPAGTASSPGGGALYADAAGPTSKCWCMSPARGNIAGRYDRADG